MDSLRLAIFGAGFWSRFQLAAWRELPNVEIVAIYNRTQEKAEEVAAAFNIPKVYTDPETLVLQEKPDAIDIITDVSTHYLFVMLAVRHHIPVICQKPMSSTLAEAERLVQYAQGQNVPFFIHENWRWQTPLRQLKYLLDEGQIGRPFRARIQFSSSFPVFDNQPFLRDLKQFILMDIGSHILDTARFLFGEAQSLYCLTCSVNPTIQGEDVATVLLSQGEVICSCEMSYASRLEHERFPETYVLIEGENGSLELGPDYWLRSTTIEGTWAQRYPPLHYAWADPAYDLVHSSIVPCTEDILRALLLGVPAETNAADNLQTVRLVFAAYTSAQTGQVVSFH